MADTGKLKEELQAGVYDGLLLNLYSDADRIPGERLRYVRAINAYEDCFGGGDVKIFSAPGRTEIGGNHTDHQHGRVLAAAISYDAVAVVRALREPCVKVISDGYDMITVALDDSEIKQEEKETTKALIKGVLAGMRQKGFSPGGFQAYITSEVPIGAGLSSSAAYETLIGTILSGLYHNDGIPAPEIAKIGQYAENIYFGKPCGLMDQMACSVGNLVYVDLFCPEEPKVKRIDFDMNRSGYSICITDTKGSHANLTADYAAIPEEMEKVAHFFGKEVMAHVSRDMLFSAMGELRKNVGDRAVLRALHFIGENERVKAEAKALREGEMDAFLAMVKESGDSSFKYLQNVYSNSDVEHQSISVALAFSDMILKENGVSRVHGGGFAGTIQAFVKNDAVENYKKNMDFVFGDDSCHVLKIRKYGGFRVV